MPNPYNEIEISEDEKASISSENSFDAEPTQDAKGESVSEEPSNQEVRESDTKETVGLFDEAENRYIELDEIQQWRESFNNQSNWQKSNTEKAQGIAKWSKLMDKVSSDDDFRAHISEYFGDDKNTISSLGLNGIEAIKEAIESSEENTETQNPDKLQSLEERVNGIELDKKTDVLEMQFNQFASENKSLSEEKAQVEFLQFMADRKLSNFEEAFKFWDYDNAQEQLKHYKELEQNKQRNTGKVIQTKTVGATKEKTPHRIANDYKNVNMDDPEIAKYFE